MKLFITIFITLFIAITAFGQDNRDSKKERIKALKIAFITERLELTTDEAQAFWPIYNNYDSKMSEIHRTERTVLKDTRDRFESMEEADAKSTLQKIQTFEEQKMNARKELLKSLKDNLSYKKTLILLKSEGDFRRDLLRRLRGDKDGNRSPKEHR